MLRLICGQAAASMRQLLVDSFVESRGEDGTVFVVPDENYALATGQQWARQAGVLRTGAILSMPALSQWVLESASARRSTEAPQAVEEDLVAGGDWFGLAPSPSTAEPTSTCVVEPPERLAILRQILLRSPSRYDRLVGERSAPHLTHGVLVRIADATARVMDRDRAAAETGEADTWRDTPRLRQLRDLGRAYEQRLEKANAIEARVAIRQAWTTLTAEDLEQFLPHHKRIVLDGFDAFDELAILAVRRLRDTAADVLILLDYDPEHDAERYSHLNAAYERLFDLADDALLDPSSFAPGASAAHNETVMVQIVDTPTRAREVQAIAQFLRSEIDSTVGHNETNTFAYHDYTVCFPALESYAPLIRKTFAQYGLPCTIARGEPMLRQPMVRLLDAIRNAIAAEQSLPAMRDLLKSPLLPALLENHGTSAEIETIKQAQTLERLRREEGVNSVGHQLIVDLRSTIDRANRELAAHEQRMADSEDEHPRIPLLRAKINSYQVLEKTLAATMRLLEDVAPPRDFSQWRDYLRTLMLACINYVLPGERDPVCAAAPGIQLPPRERAQMAEVFRAIERCAQRLVDCGPMLVAAQMNYPQFLGLLRVLLRGEKVKADPEPQQGFRVSSIAPARGRQSRFLVLGGMVDTEYPQYLNRDARLEEDTPLRLDQAQHIARQRFQFDHLLASATDRAILFIPRGDSQSELLESQFVEELETARGSSIVRTSDESFIASLPPRSPSANEVLDQVSAWLTGNLETMDKVEVPPALQNREFTPAEKAVLGNIVHNLGAEAERKRPDALGNFDGFISDPVLLKHLQQRMQAHIHSVSQLDVLVQCPFRYFVENVLGVRELVELEEGTAPRRLGELVHAILAGFYREWIISGHGPVNASTKSDAGVLLAVQAEHQLNSAALTRFERDSLTFRLYGSHGLAGLRDGIPDAAGGPLYGVRDYPGVLPAFLDLEVERAENTGDHILRPAFFELGFGLPRSHRDESDKFSTPEPVALELPGNETIRLRGRSDRVDLGEGIFAIVDYKTGSAPTITAQQSGYKVQLPVYLMAIEQVLREKGHHLQPAGGMFICLTPRKSKIEGQFFRKQFLGMAGISGKRGMTDNDFEEAMSLVRERIANGLALTRAGRFHVTMAGERIACGMCGNARICRKDLARTERLVPQMCRS